MSSYSVFSQNSFIHVFFHLTLKHTCVSLKSYTWLPIAVHLSNEQVENLRMEEVSHLLKLLHENTARKQHMPDIPPPNTLFLRINTFLIWQICQDWATSTSISALTLLLAVLGIPFKHKWNNSSENKAEIFLGVWFWSQMLSWCIIKRWNTLSVRKKVTFAWAVLMGRW